MDVAAEVHALYGLPAAGFTVARDALAKRLRAAGMRDEAAAVKSLRRPSAAAAAINRTARSHSEAVDELLAAGQNVRRAQDRLIAGRGDASVLREATEHVREASSALAALVAARAAEDGTPLSPALLERVRETLQAAVLREEIAAALRDGRLEREAGAAGIALGSALPGVAAADAAPPAPERAEPSSAAHPPAAERAAAEERARAAEQAREAARELRRLHGELERAQRRAARTAQAEQDARARLAEAEAQARAAESEVAELRVRIDALEP